MISLLHRYVDELQVLRVKAGLTAVGRDELIKLIVKDSLIVLTLIAVVFLGVSAFNYHNHQLTYWFITALTIMPILIPYLRYKLLIRRRSKMLENEFTFFIISEASTLTDYTELLNDICELRGWELVFPTLTTEGLRLKVYRKFLTLFETINHYIKYVPSELISRLLSDYMLALSRGIVSAWITHTSSELIHNLRSDTKALIRLRTATVLVIGILVSYLPALLFSLSVITGDKELTSALILTPAVVVGSMLVLPRNTLHLTLYFKLGLIRKSFIIASYTLMVILLYSTLSDFTSVRYLTLLVASVTSINGVLGLIKFCEAINEVYEVPKVTYMFAETPYILVSPVKALRDVLSGCKSRSFRALGARLDLNNYTSMASYLNSWIGRYTYYIISKSLINGSLSKEQLLSLRVLTMDMLEDFKQYLVSALPLIIISLMVPWLMISMTSLAGVNLMEYGFAIYLVTITYSVYVDYVVFNTHYITLISGITLLFLGFIWVI
ncbi:MAG: hypothetical protein RMH77_06370 [Sulfolobales archaeon]|nr:hypothetical protein [Sulfolobales archaeon]MDW7970006.1 hypothetical protein [Sulfolobales archaeon]